MVTAENRAPSGLRFACLCSCEVTTGKLMFCFAVLPSGIWQQPPHKFITCRLERLESEENSTHWKLNNQRYLGFKGSLQGLFCLFYPNKYKSCLHLTPVTHFPNHLQFLECMHSHWFQFISKKIILPINNPSHLLTFMLCQNYNIIRWCSWKKGWFSISLPLGVLNDSQTSGLQGLERSGVSLSLVDNSAFDLWVRKELLLKRAVNMS